ncbi:hypothetical protein ACFXJ8_36795 [Nonomuraea sp. NPDC059194]|uniref:hypothetical protein n=1 Tax=Nonomuraea sp. NPDC059194 TaxID=3346764 RepID=UPI0036AABC72
MGDGGAEASRHVLGLQLARAATNVVAVQRGTGAGAVLALGGLFVTATLVLTVRAHVRRAALVRRMRELTGEEKA